MSASRKGPAREDAGSMGGEWVGLGHRQAVRTLVLEPGEPVEHLSTGADGVERAAGCQVAPRPLAAFDIKVPHWFGSTGDAPAEILSIFGRPGERMTIRTTPGESATPPADG